MILFGRLSARHVVSRNFYTVRDARSVCGLGRNVLHVFAFALLVGLFAAPQALRAQQQDNPPGSGGQTTQGNNPSVQAGQGGVKTETRYAAQASQIERPDGGCGAGNKADACWVLGAGRSNVLRQNAYGCYFFDNPGGQNLFIPEGSSQDFMSFINNGAAANGVKIDPCCPSFGFTVGPPSDGVSLYTLVAPVGRDRVNSADGDFQPMEHSFAQSSRACTTHWDGSVTCNNCDWTEKFSGTAVCNDKSWSFSPTRSYENLVGSFSSKSPPVCAPPAYIEPRTCPPFAHGNRRFVDFDPANPENSRAANAVECPYGAGSRRYVWDVETELQCWDGAETPTGATREANHRYTGTCQPQRVDGACGSSGDGRGFTVSSPPSANFCNAGDFLGLNGSGPWNWVCNGSGGGNPANCAAPVRANGVCGYTGTIAGRPAESLLCAVGTRDNYRLVSTSNAFGLLTENYAWECRGVAGGGPTSCSVTAQLPFAADGACGTAHNSRGLAAPTGNFCVISGTNTPVTGSGPWSWSCPPGAGGGNTASCQAFRDCSGSFRHGDRNYVPSGTDSRAAQVPAECPYAPGDRRYNWTVESEVQCVNGSTVATGQTRNTNHYWSGSCGMTYSWQSTGNFSGCSAPCGGGTRTEIYGCRAADGNWVADGFCSGSKPAPTPSCNTQACPVSGACGSANGQPLMSPPDAGQGCAHGAGFHSGPSAAGNGAFQWSCQGLHGGGPSATCSSAAVNCGSGQVRVNGICRDYVQPVVATDTGGYFLALTNPWMRPNRNNGRDVVAYNNSALWMCARAGQTRLFDFAGFGWYGRFKKHSDADVYQVNFWGSQNLSAQVLDGNLYQFHRLAKKDTEDWGPIHAALCGTGDVILVPSVTPLVSGSYSPPGDPPAGVPACPFGAGASVDNTVRHNPAYFASALQGVGPNFFDLTTPISASFLWLHGGSHADQPYTPALCRQPLDCYADRAETICIDGGIEDSWGGYQYVCYQYATVYTRHRVTCDARVLPSMGCVQSYGPLEVHQSWTCDWTDPCDGTHYPAYPLDNYFQRRRNVNHQCGVDDVLYHGAGFGDCSSLPTSCDTGGSDPGYS